MDNWSNFQQYDLSPPVGLLRMDAHHPAFRIYGEGFLDAIICDPPYGVRAGGRRSVSEEELATRKKSSSKPSGVKSRTHSPLLSTLGAKVVAK